MYKCVSFYCDCGSCVLSEDINVRYDCEYAVLCEDRLTERDLEASEAYCIIQREPARHARGIRERLSAIND